MLKHHIELEIAVLSVSYIQFYTKIWTGQLSFKFFYLSMCIRQYLSQNGKKEALTICRNNQADRDNWQMEIRLALPRASSRLDPPEASVALSAPAKPEGQTSCCSCICRN